MSKKGILGRVLPTAVAAVTLLAGSAISISSAHASTKSLRIAGSFVYIGTHHAHNQCSWAIGIMFPQVPGASSYTINYYDGYYRAQESGSMSVPIPAASKYRGAPYFGITGGNGDCPHPAPPADAGDGGRFLRPPVVYANFSVSENYGFITGIVANKDGSPVEGASINAYGTQHASAVSGPGGAYLMKVKAGHYRVVPDDPAIKLAAFTPTSRLVTVAKNSEATANFTIDAGLQLTMTFSSYKVPASGFEIVRGSIATSQFGRPAPDIAVELSVSPTDPAAALTTSPRVALCSPAGRIWPQGQLANLNGSPINVATNDNGKYDFTMTVGTKPGTWSLDAWAKNTDGTLSSDTTKASETKNLTIAPLSPTTSISDFLLHVQSLKGTAIASQFDPSSPATFATVMGQLAQTYGSDFGGLAFTYGAGTDGPNLLVAPATANWQIATNGAVKRNPSMLEALVLDPQEWTGTNSLNTAMQGGFLQDIPTVNAWESGATKIPGWSLKTNTLLDPQGALVGFGWAYAPLAAAAKGYCN